MTVSLKLIKKTVTISTKGYVPILRPEVSSLVLLHEEFPLPQ